MSAKKAPLLGVFDSGIGGLSVLRAIRAQIPAQPVIYFGDQLHVPYGARSLDQVREFSRMVVQFLFAQGAALIVVACNTASVAALHPLRDEFPQIPFVGMEPAVKPAAELTRTGVVGVLATYATFQGELYASVVERFAKGVTVMQDPCTGLVAEIEKGNLDGPETRAILERALNPMLEKGIDTVVMGCTHYPFVIPLIQQITGPNVRVIDPAPAVARQTRRLLELHKLLAPGESPVEVRFITSGSPNKFSEMLVQLLGESHPVEQALWHNDETITLVSPHSFHS